MPSIEVGNKLCKVIKETNSNALSVSISEDFVDGYPDVASCTSAFSDL